MKLFNDRMARWAAIALLIHGLLILLVGLWLFIQALDAIKHPEGPYWRIVTAVSGSALAILVGSAIVGLSIVRLAKPFPGIAAKGLRGSLETLFVAEVLVVVFIGGLILDGGGMQMGLFFLSLILNLLLLAIFGGRSSSGA